MPETAAQVTMWHAKIHMSSTFVGLSLVEIQTFDIRRKPSIVAHAGNTRTKEVERQEGFKFETSLGHIMKLCLKTNRFVGPHTWIKVLAAKADNLIQNPGTMGWKARTDSHRLFSDLRMCAIAHTSAHDHKIIQSINKQM